ncbi:MAG: RidA family protein [Thermomicrobiales bacterium]|nr:RidA family protein [Thermomicrobiales bacterium]
MSVSARLEELGIVLPEPARPVATYVRYVQTGNLLFISGTGPGPEIRPGKLGADMTLEEGYAAARSVGLSLLATAQDVLGDLDRVQRLVKLLGMVNSTPDFVDHPQVINGCSDLFVEVFGESGYGSRSAVGFVSLPHGIPVEIECTLEVK